MTLRKIIKSRKDYQLNIQVTTSTNKDHSSFDFQTSVHEQNHVMKSNFKMDLDYKFVFIFRNEKIRFESRQSLKVEPYDKSQDLLGVFEIRYINKNIILRFHEIEDLMNDKTYGQNNNIALNNKFNHHIYIIVRSFTNQKNQSTGFKLSQGSLLKIGQKQYFISSICTQDNLINKSKQNITILSKCINNNDKIVVVDQDFQKGQCKYCMLQEGEDYGQFLCTPCKCSGSCASVHFNCLEKWNKSKVKIERIKGVTYYNFQRFSCEVCKEQYPTVIIKKGVSYELMPIQIPKGRHLIIQQIELKNAALIVIEDFPEGGIRMGRGHQCQIRIQNPSISRNHAIINHKFGDYYIFDSKSKFGTAIRENKIYLQLDMTKKGIQIDRTVIMMQLIKNQKIQ